MISLLRSLAVALLGGGVVAAGVRAAPPLPPGDFPRGGNTSSSVDSGELSTADHQASNDSAFVRINDLVESVRKKHDVIALAGAVVDEAGVWAIGVAGVREAGSKTPVEINDRFHIGSCTKSMTATVCAKLVEDKRLSWHTTIADSFPEIKEKINPAFLPVTLEQLLCHRAGLPEDGKPGTTFFQILVLEGDIRERRQKAVELFMAKEPSAPPGSQFIYSNAGFVIAGAMAERASGRNWETLMTEYLFEPLGMETAGFGAPGSAEVLDQPRGHAAGMVWGRNPVIPGPFADNPEVLGPAGRVHCSLMDWGKYAALHLAATQRDTSFLTQSAFGEVLQHAGSNTRWYARIHLDTGRRVGYLMATNHVDDAAVAAATELLPELVRWSRERGPRRE